MVAVAPLRGRGLKPPLGHHDHRLPRRSLTGAWIETALAAGVEVEAFVAPLRGRGLKLPTNIDEHQYTVSLPYGGVD